MEYKDYYSILGITREADAAEIKKAYRKLAAKYHPDANPGDELAVKKFKDISEAYEVLRDPEKKKIYDRAGSDWKRYHRTGGAAEDFNWSQYRRQGAPGGFSYEYRSNVDDLFGSTGGSPFSDFFENLFGGGFTSGKASGMSEPAGSGMRRNLDQQATMDVSLEDIAHGAVKTFMFNGKRVRVKIPRGIRNGQKLKLAGRGKASPAGGKAGDLYIQINEKPHSEWRRSGDDLIIEKDANLYTLILGGSIDIRTPRGVIKVSVPELWQPGKSLRLKGQGLPAFRKEGNYGDLLLKLNCLFPKKLSATEKELFEQLKQMNAEMHK